MKLYKVYQKNATQYNLMERTVQFRSGDKVWKRNFVLSSAPNKFSSKLAPKYIPCIISKVISPFIYELKDSQGNLLGKYQLKTLSLIF